MCVCACTNLGFSGVVKTLFIVVARYDSMMPSTYNIGLHPKKKKKQNAQHTHREQHTRTHTTHTHSNVRVTTAASETEGVAAVSWIESVMIRRPFGSIDPNSIRETELHKESRRRHSRGERESLHSPQLDRERGCCSSEGCRYA